MGMHQRVVCRCIHFAGHLWVEIILVHWWRWKVGHALLCKQRGVETGMAHASKNCGFFGYVVDAYLLVWHVHVSCVFLSHTCNVAA